MADFPATADVVIVGGGVHGASIAYHLAKKGAGRVVLLEKDFLAAGPTGRSSALVRRFYPVPFLARTANTSADTFMHWADVIGGGDPGFHQVGYLALATPDKVDHLKHNVATALRVGSRVRLITPDEIRQLVPGIAVDDIALAAFEDESGYADPSSTTTALANRARELGATILQHTEVTAIVVEGQRVTGVRTAKGDIATPKVVHCAGVWADRLLRPLDINVPIKPTRHQMAFFRRPPEVGVHPAIGDNPNVTYMRPDHGNLTIFGVTTYHEVCDPDHYNEGADADEIGRAAELIVRRLPAMEDAVSRGGYSGLYDLTPDKQPVLGPIPEYDGLYADFGWSGHGFKHSPTIGDIMADVVLHGRSEQYDVTPFRWSRFRDGELLPHYSLVSPPADRVIP